MRRGYIVIIFLLLSSLACGLFGTATQAPQVSTSAASQVPASPASQVTSSSAPQVTSTSGPLVTSSTTLQVPSTSQPTVTRPVKQATSISTLEEPTKTPYPTSVLDASLTNQVNLIQTQVIEERGLQPKNPVPVVLLSPDELRSNMINDFMADYTDGQAADDVLELSIIGLLPPGFDIHGMYINLYSEGVAGYYDNQTKEMFIVQGQGFQGPERLTYSHEYTHALQDQNYDIRNGLNYNNDACKLDSERCAGVQALIEGDAYTSEGIWYQYYATSQDKQQIDAFYSSFKSPVYDSAPDFIKDDFSFAPITGTTFVQALFDNGGWAAVDAAYLNPPVSTEQILHPNLYPSDKPIPVDLPDLTSALGEGWREVSHNQMGEFDTYEILARGVNTNARLDDNTAKAAAAGWGGDEYIVLSNDTTGHTAFVMKTVWDTSNDATEFASAFEKYANARFGVTTTMQGNTSTWTYNGGVTTLYLSGDTTIWITAPDPASIQALTTAVQP